ncbi:unnamed protein product [Effrenium voratum]|uniref:WW domain-containing protein n=1 Tax=Effrenium voratum TaxID=2562239 RepID=A0AA36JBH2_9DINO|nr:unnamed protein product [Effrenium voratum]
MARVPRAFLAAPAPLVAPKVVPTAAPATTPAAKSRTPKVVPPPRRRGAGPPGAGGPGGPGAPNAVAKARKTQVPLALERGMVVSCEDGSSGTVDSVFAALDEVWLLPQGSTSTVKLRTGQVTFLGQWSDQVDIINSIDVPPDVEEILGVEQLEQLQELAGQVPVHLESFTGDGDAASKTGATTAQLVFGPASAKAVKQAVDTVVNHVDGLDFPEAKLLSMMQPQTQMQGGWPMMMMPVWPGANGPYAGPAGWAPDGWAMASYPQVPSVPTSFVPMTSPNEPSEPSPDPSGTTSPSELSKAPWHNQQLPPPPSQKNNSLSWRAKRHRAGLEVKQEPEEQAMKRVKEDPDESDKSLLFWAQRQDQFSELPKLPSGWIRVPSKSSGSIYYVNLPTGESTFTSPISDELPPGWEVVTSRSTGKQYYWHAEHQISQFERPTE